MFFIFMVDIFFLFLDFPNGYLLGKCFMNRPTIGNIFQRVDRPFETSQLQEFCMVAQLCTKLTDVIHDVILQAW